MRAPTGRPLDDRLAALTALRGAIAALAVGLSIGSDRIDADLVLATGAYVAVVAVLEIVRRWRRRVAERLAPLAICMDGSFAVAALVLTGGPANPLVAVVFLVISVAALLMSHRAGVGVAVWCALALAVVHAATDAGGVGLGIRMTDRSVAVAAASFLIFGAVITVVSRLSEVGLRRGGARLAALVELDTLMDRADQDDDVLAALLRHACESLGFTRAAVLIRRRGEWRGVVGTAAGRSRTYAETAGGNGLLRAEALDAEAAEVLATGEPALVRSLATGVLAKVLPDAANVVVVPVAADDDRFGVVAGVWGGRSGRRIPAGTVRALTDAAAHAGLTLRHRTMVEEIERLATRDAVTGLANRRLLEETLVMELGRAEREGTPLSVVVIDVDHFKHVNDTRGHPAGDEVLRQIGQALVHDTKAYDLAARLGGDEFVVVLPGCDRDHVLAVAERLRAAIADHVEAAPVTVSAGVATLPDDAVDGDRLLVAADAALYEAKRLGRDRAVVPGGSISWHT